MQTQAYEWYKAFKEGRTVVENLPHPRCPATSITDENIEKVKKLVLENRRVTEREIAAELEISNGSVHSILHDVLGMRRVAARLVPKMLNFLQKEHRKSIAEEMLTMAETSVSKTQVAAPGEAFQDD